MLDRLNAHRAWANRLYVEWMAAMAVPDEYVLKMFSHVLRAEETWLVRLQGGIPENRIWTLVPPGEIDALRAANDGGMEEALAGDVSRVLRYDRFDGTPMESTAADVLTHVCTHGMYHRGQIASHAARVGSPKAPVTDFIAFTKLFP